ncbi:MAG: hypothetical protein Q8Q22_00170, partial [bacterium]|nr:hypothetical protein [bacterium]
MPNQELLDFVKLKRGQGINDEEIKKELVASGWPEITVNESLGSLASPISPQIETKISRFPVVIAFVAGIIFVAGIYIVAGGVKWPQGVGKEYNTKEIANIWGSSVVRIVCD